jgi:hypothetical protein
MKGTRRLKGIMAALLLCSCAEQTFEQRHPQWAAKYRQSAQPVQQFNTSYQQFMQKFNAQEEQFKQWFQQQRAKIKQMPLEQQGPMLDELERILNQHYRDSDKILSDLQQSLNDIDRSSQKEREIEALEGIRDALEWQNISL